MKEPVISLKGIVKEFPGVRALDDVSLDIYPGEVHVLIGENGAGKSTLFNVMAGIHQPDKGDIVYKGKKVHFLTPHQAIRSGIAMIHQELSAVKDLTVAENLFLGKEPIRNGVFLDYRAMNNEAERALSSIGINVKPTEKIRNLKTAQVQMVEIAKAVFQKASVIIMDEPTSSLSEFEVKVLFDIIEKLKAENVAIIYVSHRLKEIYQIGDAITVLRDGIKITSLPIEQTDENMLISLMVGRDFSNFIRSESHASNDIILEVGNLTRTGVFSDISFTLRRGEVFGFAGLIGAGRTEVLRALYGADRYDSGSVSLYGKKVFFKSPREAIKAGIGLVPEDRRLQGILVDDTAVRNIALPSLREVSIRGFVNKVWEKNVAEEYVGRMRIKTPSIHTVTKNLSGGNQQKVIIAKWLAANSNILFLDEPTRGIDVNAKAEIYELINAFTENGGSVVMVSSELVELLSVCDRIAVMREGEMRCVLNHEEATEEIIMKFASISGPSDKELEDA